VQAGGHLSEEEHRLYDYYGMDWDESWARANQPGEGGWAHQGAAGAGAAAGERRGRTDDAMAGGADAMAGGADAMAGGTDRDAPGRAGTDDAMTRSEERMHVGVERREAGRARLRTYVVTEQEERTVPVRHEERPVVETEAVPVERVRLTTEEQTEQRTVRGEVRKERIEGEAERADDPDDPRFGRWSGPPGRVPSAPRRRRRPPGQRPLLSSRGPRLSGLRDAAVTPCRESS
jgi:hypothetical protein